MSATEKKMTDKQKHEKLLQIKERLDALHPLYHDLVKKNKEASDVLRRIRILEKQRKRIRGY